jgi:hypothetical protein
MKFLAVNVFLCSPMNKDGFGNDFWLMVDFANRIGKGDLVPIRSKNLEPGTEREALVSILLKSLPTRLRPSLRSESCD